MIPLLKNIDMFGAEFKLNIRGKETFTTLLGGLSTSILGMITIVLAWYFGKDIYQKVNPYYLSKTTYKNHTPMMELNTSNFFFAFRVEDDNGIQFKNESFFHYRFKYQYIEIDSTIGSIKVLNDDYSDGEICSSAHIDNDTLHSKGLYNFYCSNLSGFKLGGDWRSPYISIISYYLERCRDALRNGQSQEILHVPLNKILLN